MACRRSAVRSRLAPPHLHKAAHRAAFVFPGAIILRGCVIESDALPCMGHLMPSDGFVGDPRPAQSGRWRDHRNGRLDSAGTRCRQRSMAGRGDCSTDARPSGWSDTTTSAARVIIATVSQTKCPVSLHRSAWISKAGCWRCSKPIGVMSSMSGRSVMSACLRRWTASLPPGSISITRRPIACRDTAWGPLYRSPLSSGSVDSVSRKVRTVLAPDSGLRHRQGPRRQHDAFSQSPSPRAAASAPRRPWPCSRPSARCGRS